MDHFGSFAIEAKGSRKACSFRRQLYTCDAATCRYLGDGSYGFVYTAQMRVDRTGAEKVAIKKNTDIFDTTRIDAQRAYREMHILRQLCHPHKELVEGDVAETDAEVGVTGSTPGTGDWKACKVERVNHDGSLDLLLVKDGAAISSVVANRVRPPRSPYVVYLKDVFSPAYPPPLPGQGTGGFSIFGLFGGSSGGSSGSGGGGAVRAAPTAVQDFKDLCLTFEFCDTDLKNVQERSTLSFDNVRYIMYQIIAGMKYVHSAKVIHRDLKPANILINLSDFSVKIADFGLSRVIDESLRDSAQAADRQVTYHVITRWYRCPEVILFDSLLQSSYTDKVDIWSIGVIFAELLHVLAENLNSARLCSRCASDALLDAPSVAGLAAKYQKKDTEILRRWDQQRAFSVCPRDILDETSSLDFSLEPEEIDAIDKAAAPLPKAYFRDQRGININPLHCISCKSPKAQNCYRRPFIPGTAAANDWGVNFSDECDQLLLSMKLTGLPTADTLERYFKPNSADIQQLKRLSPANFQALDLDEIFPAMRSLPGGSDALDLLRRLMVFDPDQRISAEQALEHPFLANCPQRRKETEHTYHGHLQNGVLEKAKERTFNLFESVKQEFDFYNHLVTDYYSTGATSL